MSTKNKRFMLTVPDDIESDAAEVKKDLYYNKPYSEMYRQLIRKGLDALKQENAAKEKEHEKAS